MTLLQSPLKMTLVLGALTSLVACGGSSSGPITAGVPNFGSAQAATNHGLTRIEAIGDLDLTPPNQIRRSGTATYDGSIVLNDESGFASQSASVIGGIAVEIDFANANNVSGTAGNFFDAQGARVGGTMDLSNVIFDQGTAGGGFVADLDGTLTGIGGSTNYVYDLELGVIYFGNNTDALLGFVNGTASSGSVPRSIAGASVLE